LGFDKIEAMKCPICGRRFRRPRAVRKHLPPSRRISGE